MAAFGGQSLQPLYVNIAIVTSIVGCCYPQERACAHQGIGCHAIVVAVAQSELSLLHLRRKTRLTSCHAAHRQATRGCFMSRLSVFSGGGERASLSTCKVALYQTACDLTECRYLSRLPNELRYLCDCSDLCPAQQICRMRTDACSGDCSSSPVSRSAFASARRAASVSASAMTRSAAERSCKTPPETLMLRTEHWAIKLAWRSTGHGQPVCMYSGKALARHRQPPRAAG